MLQEFVQCSKQFHAPQHRPILQWHFDTRMDHLMVLEFRATVSFMLDGVAHHVAGTWYPSKKFAQRDAAERALGLFVRRWGEFLLTLQDSQDVESKGPCGSVTSLHELEVLEEFCRDAPACAGSGPLKWSTSWQGCQCRAVIELVLLGVTHKFSGQVQHSEEAAKLDTARRVLWYLRCPGFGEAYEPDPYACAATAREIPPPPANWASSSEEEEDAHLAAERKTALMRVQNRLQQAFARHMRPGQSVWEWSYQCHESGSEWPPMHQATVYVPILGRSFTGAWVRGQRDAQISASEQVGAFLDAHGAARQDAAPPVGAVY